MTDTKDWGFRTRAIRTGQVRSAEGEHSEPIFMNSSFLFEDSAQAAARFSGEQPGNIYSRFTNPTVRTFERRLADLEGGERCVATASGMSAILSACLGLLRAGDHVITSRGVFGATFTLFSQYLTRYGIEVSFVSLTDLAEWKAACKPNTKMLFIETPSNPTMEVADVRALADIAHDAGALLAVDNCFCTPALQQPLSLGADIVIHSATKYIDGQGRCLGGAIIGREDVVGKDIYGFVRTCGPTMSPFNAWIFSKGLETLALRMDAHSRNANELAHWLQTQPGVRRVLYPGLASHPQHELAQRQQSAFGGIVSFEVEGGREAAWRVIDGTQLMSVTANLGDAKTTITHPASTTHGRVSAEDRAAAGVTEGLIRVAVGLEDIADLKADLGQSLSASVR